MICPELLDVHPLVGVVFRLVVDEACYQGFEARYFLFEFEDCLSNHGTNIYGFFGLVPGLQLESMLFFYFSLSFCSAMVSSTICCNWYVATPNGLLIPLRDHSTMVLLWERHISSPMLGLSSSPLRSSSAALT